jgi:putative membrane protein insertion efficiency factor
VTDRNIIQAGEDKFDLQVDPKDAVLIERHFSKHTKRDVAIHTLPVPSRPRWLRIIVRSIRFYQKHISHKLGNSCVFDPSCSHYSEMAFREKGFYRGLKLTIARLKRCRPENGGVDELSQINK